MFWVPNIAEPTAYLLHPIPGSSDWMSSRADTQDFYFLRTEQNTAIQPNSAQSEQEVTHQTNNITSS